MKALIISLLNTLACTVQAQVGLQGNYYKGANFEKRIFVRTDPKIDFHWAQHAKSGKGFEDRYFSIRWTGQIYAPSTAIYYFSAKTNDELQIWVDNHLVLGGLSKANEYKFGGSITLLGKRWYPIKIEYRNEGFTNDRRPRSLVLYWETLQDRLGPIGESGAFRKIIPTHYLSPQSASVQPVTMLTGVALKRPANGSQKQRTTVAPIDSSSTIIGQSEQTFTKPTIRLKKGESLVLEQVQFEQGSYILPDESLPILNQLVNILISSPFFTLRLVVTQIT